MNIQSIQNNTNNMNFTGLRMPKKITLGNKKLDIAVLNKKDILQNQAISDCSKIYDVVIKKNKIVGYREFTSKESHKFILGGSIGGTLLSIGVSTLLKGFSNTLISLADTCIVGGIVSTTMSACCLRIFKALNITPGQYEYTLQAGEKYNKKNGKFIGTKTKIHRLYRNSDINNLGDLIKEIEDNKKRNNNYVIRRNKNKTEYKTEVIDPNKILHNDGDSMEDILDFIEETRRNNNS